MTHDPTPEALAARASRGDEDAFTALCDALKTRLFRAARGILGDEDLALDAVSEAVYRAFKGIRKLREPKYAETWFIRIALNAAKDINRRRKHEVAVEEPPEGIHYDDHRRFEMEQLVANLPEELRETIAIHYYADYPILETAMILGIPEGTAKSRLNRALRLLRLEVLDG